MMLINTTRESDVAGIRLDDEICAKLFEHQTVSQSVKSPGEMIRNLSAVIVSLRENQPLQAAFEYVNLHIEDID